MASLEAYNKLYMCVYIYILSLGFAFFKKLGYLEVRTLENKKIVFLSPKGLYFFFQVNSGVFKCTTIDLIFLKNGLMVSENFE